jgi:hypothetical protein
MSGVSIQLQRVGRQGMRAVKISRLSHGAVHKYTRTLAGKMNHRCFRNTPSTNRSVGSSPGMCNLSPYANTISINTTSLAGCFVSTNANTSLHATSAANHQMRVLGCQSLYSTREWSHRSSPVPRSAATITPAAQLVPCPCLPLCPPLAPLASDVHQLLIRKYVLRED